MSYSHVLVVEDDPDSAAVVGKMLSIAGIESTLATSAEIALAQLYAAPHNFNAVIADLALPEMDGVELLDVIRQESELAHLKLVAVTAFHTPELRVKLLDAGVDGYFAKPLDMALFVKALKKLLIV